MKPPSDTTLLNWMISHGARISWSRDNEVCNVWVLNYDYDSGDAEVPAEGYPQKSYYDPREAIKAAMKARS